MSGREGRRVPRWWWLLGSILVVLAPALAFRTGAPAVHLQVGTGQELWLQAEGVQPPERNMAGPFRWLEPRSRLVFGDAFPAAYQLMLRVHGLPREPGDRVLTVTVNGLPAASVALQDSWQEVRLSLPLRRDDAVLLENRRLELDLTTDAATVPGDPRRFGAAIDTIDLFPDPSPICLLGLGLGLLGAWLAALLLLHLAGITPQRRVLLGLGLALAMPLLAVLSPYALAIIAAWLARHLATVAVAGLALWLVGPLSRRPCQAALARFRGEFALAGGIVLAGGVLRFTRLRELVPFDADQGGQLVQARRIFTAGQLPLTGPLPSIGGFHIGPGYYYALGLAGLPLGFDPLAGSLLAAASTTLACALLYVLGRSMFGAPAGAIAAAGYAFSPLNLAMGTLAWNPSSVPLFAALGLYSLFRVERGDTRWLLGLAAVAAAVANQHASAVLLGIPLLAALGRHWRKTSPATTVGCLVVLAAGVAPLLVYQVQQGWPDLQAATAFLDGAHAEENLRDALPPLLRAAVTLGDLWHRLAIPPVPLAGGLLALGGARVLLLHVRDRGTPAAAGTRALLLWMAMLLPLAAFKAPLFDHYFVLFVPVPFLLVGLGLSGLAERRLLMPLAALATAAIVTWQGYAGLAYVTSSPANALAHLEDAARFVAADAAGRPVALEVKGDPAETGEGVSYVFAWMGVTLQRNAALRYTIYRPAWSPDYREVVPTVQFGEFKLVRD